MTWNRFTVEPLRRLGDMRAFMPIVQNGVYLDHAAAGPLPLPVAEAMHNRILSGAEFGVRHWSDWYREIDRTRRLAAELTGNSPDEIAFVPNTATGIGIVAEGFRWKPGDNVVLSQSEFPSNRFPWLHLRRRGVDVRVVDTPDSSDGFIAAIDSACDSRTQIIAASWVDYATGVRRNPEQLAAIAHRHNALLVLDAIQGLGVLPINCHAAGVDVLVADSRKWMLGPEGAGILAVRQQHLERFDVDRVGWAGMNKPFDFHASEIEFSPAARRFEPGMPNTFGLTGLQATLQWLRPLPSTERADRLLEVRRMFVEAGLRAGLSTSELPESEQSGIIIFETGERDASSLVQFLNRNSVTVNLKYGRVRVSPHLYNDSEDADRFAATVANWWTLT